MTYTKYSSGSTSTRQPVCCFGFASSLFIPPRFEAYLASKPLLFSNKGSLQPDELFPASFPLIPEHDPPPHPSRCGGWFFCAFHVRKRLVESSFLLPFVSICRLDTGWASTIHILML